jgi:hypothetical protein
MPAMLLLVFLFQVGSATAAAGPDPQMPSTTLVKRLAADAVVDLTEVTVTGELDLRDVQTVRGPFRCTSCVFTGDVLGRDVTFDRVVDVTGSRFDGSLDFRGAVFRGGLLLRGTEDQPAQVGAEASFVQATFGDGTGFDRATFADRSDFTGSTFLGESSFADALFQEDAFFDDATFGGNTLFSSLAFLSAPSGPPGPCQPPVMGAFLGLANFERTAFRGPANFRQRCFVGEADFESATFGKRVDFALASFHSPASFDGVTFESDGAFLGTIFEREASFLQAASSGSLGFEDAVFDGELGLFRLSVARTLSFEGSQFRGGVDLRRALVSDLLMDVADVGSVEGRAKDRQDVLRLIEKSADGRGDLALANDARFELLSIQNARLGWFLRAADWFFYRLIAGYLVRPLYPLVAFLVLLGVGAVIRAALRSRRASSAPTRSGRSSSTRGSSVARRSHAGLLGTARLASTTLQGLGDTIQVAFKRKPEIVMEHTEQLRSYLAAGTKWLEFLAFKILIALFLLALASSNSTLKQLLDSVRG